MGLLFILDALPGAFSYGHRVTIWQISVFLSGIFLFRLRRLPPGWSRLLVALPVLLLNILLCFLFDGDSDLLTNISCFILTTALSSMKALGWALNRGPLVRPLNAPQFLSVYVFPITPREELGAVSGEREGAAKKADGAGASAASVQRKPGGRLAESGGTPLQNAGAFCGKAVLVAGVTYVLANYNPPRLVKTNLFNVSLWCGLSMGMDAPAALSGSLLGLEIAPHFDNPYISKSIGEFWNRRWNLTVGNALRFLIYDPILEMRLVKDLRQPAAPFSPLRRLVGVLSVFFTSGLMHEALYWYFQRGFLGTWLFYFTLWGVLVAVEAVIRGILKSRGILIPDWLGWLYTTATLGVMVDRLWWGPLLRLGLPEKAVANVLEAFQPLWTPVGVKGAAGGKMLG